MTGVVVDTNMENTDEYGDHEVFAGGVASYDGEAIIVDSYCAEKQDHKSGNATSVTNHPRGKYS